jgi:predicted nucleic acid-binding protein
VTVRDPEPILQIRYERAGLHWARLMADGKAAGRPRNGLGMIIASIAAANDCVLVTDNEKDFVDIALVNPLRGNPR